MSEGSNVLNFPGPSNSPDIFSQPVKKIASRVLKEQREWFKSTERHPDVGQRVVMRLCHDTAIRGETQSEIYPVEDVKVGQYTEGGKWIISSPHPKYDYSPLSHMGHLKENVEVTHWAIPEDGELDSWDNRFNIIRPYHHPIEIKVDQRDEEDVYKAILWGASYMVSFGGKDVHNKDSEFRKLYEILWDLKERIVPINNPK